MCYKVGGWTNREEYQYSQRSQIVFRTVSLYRILTYRCLWRDIGEECFPMVATLVGISVCSSLSVYGLTSTLGLDISCLVRI